LIHCRKHCAFAQFNGSDILRCDADHEWWGIMAEPLADDVNCLAFKNVEELAAAVERALAMNDCEVARMRKAVRDY